jgi:hypothetical protein
VSPERVMGRIGGVPRLTQRRRDLGNGALLLASAGPRLAIGQRMLFDVSDALRFGRRKPCVAAGALGFAALGASALTRK